MLINCKIILGKKIYCKNLAFLFKTKFYFISIDRKLLNRKLFFGVKKKKIFRTEYHQTLISKFTKTFAHFK